MRTSVGRKFQSATNVSLGGFIFLRFFCPALVCPELYGFTDERPSLEARRIFILLSKIIQNLSNGVQFNERYMKDLNTLVDANRDKLVRFLEAVSIPTGNFVETAQNISFEEAFNSKALIIQYLEKAQDQICKTLQDLYGPPSVQWFKQQLANANSFRQQQPPTDKDKKKVAPTGKKLGGIFRKKSGGLTVHDVVASGDLQQVVQFTRGKLKLINQPSLDDETPLHVAVTNGHTEIVKYLLDNKADPYLVDKRGWTVLHCSCFNNHESITLMLLERHHIDVSVQNDDGNTALHYFVRNNATSLSRRILSLFVKEGVDINCQVLLL